MLNYLLALVVSLVVSPESGPAPFAPSVVVNVTEDVPFVCLIIEEEDHTPAAKVCQEVVDKKSEFVGLQSSRVGKYHFVAYAFQNEDDENPIASKEVDVEVLPPAPGIKADIH